MTVLAWGAKVTPEFREKVRNIAANIGASPSHLMACMAFETGRSFAPWCRNPGSSATGLIQFMESTAQGLGTSTAALAGMSALQQLDYVWEYFKPYRGRLGALGDVYMAILYPVAVGQPDNYPVFKSGSDAYAANKGLDVNHDGVVTKGECVAFVDKLLAEGLEPGNRSFEPVATQDAAPIEDHSPVDLPPVQPEQPETFTMPIPAIILGLLQAAASVLPVIAQIKGDKTQSSAMQNVNVASKVLDVVATTVGAVNQQQAVEIVQQDPAARQKADEALRAQFFDLMKFAQEQEAAAWDRTEKSVGDARSFAEKMLGKEGWQSIGFGALIGVLSILILVGGGAFLWKISETVTTDPTTRGMIVGSAITILGQVVSYFFGSSSSSRQSGEALRNIAQGKGQA
jgi:ElaB/YqjD/DUF883 family membrane-anchored ribosome-binding protein